MTGRCVRARPLCCPLILSPHLPSERACVPLAPATGPFAVEVGELCVFGRSKHRGCELVTHVFSVSLGLFVYFFSLFLFSVSVCVCVFAPMNTSRGSASIESHDESASYKRAKDSTPAQTGPGALAGFGLAAQERAAPGIGGGVRALCRKPEEAGSGRDGAGSEKEALLVPMLVLDPGSQPAEPAGAHPVPRASFRDSALFFPPGGCALATTLHSSQGTCRLPLAPFLGAQREGWEAHRLSSSAPGTHLDRSIRPRLRCLVADGGPSIAGSRR